MRHLVKGRKLNRTASHRKALMSNLASALIINLSIKTTLPKAKELRSFVERLVTHAKKNTVHSRRLILKKLICSNRKLLANKLIHDIAPNYDNRDGGYTRIMKLGKRKNDDAEVSIIEFVDLLSLHKDKTENLNQKETDTKQE